MIAFFSAKQLDGEAIMCTGIFLVSVLYIVIFYQEVNTYEKDDREREKFDEFVAQNPENLNSIINNWR